MNRNKVQLSPSFNSNINLNKCKRAYVTFITLLFTAALVSGFIPTFSITSPFALAANEYVNNETTLKTAISSATPNTPCIITLRNDIPLTETLNIPYSLDITLKSDSTTEFFQLISMGHHTTISVNGKLTLNGIKITHSSSATGRGVLVNSGGEFYMVDGSISGNIDNSIPVTLGGGVYIDRGFFDMSGGKISDNNADCGGGVYNDCGDFVMSGGTITTNTALYCGGGVHNYKGSFALSGDSKILGNTAIFEEGGGGVYNDYGDFVMSGGTISNNTATSWNGGGVYNDCGDFVMSGGTISNNKANHCGGGVYSYMGSFTLSDDGKILGNTAEYGGGIYNMGTFAMSGGKIYDNIAYGYGGGVYNENGGTFSMLGGEISNNNSRGYGISVNESGGGVHNRGTFKEEGGLISGNIPLDVYRFENSDSGIATENNVSPNSGGFFGGSDNMSDNDNGFGLRNAVIIIIVTVIVVGVIAGLFLYFKKKGNMAEVKK